MGPNPMTGVFMKRTEPHRIPMRQMVAWCGAEEICVATTENAKG